MLDWAVLQCGVETLGSGLNSNNAKDKMGLFHGRQSKMKHWKPMGYNSVEIKITHPPVRVSGNAFPTSQELHFHW